MEATLISGREELLTSVLIMPSSGVVLIQQGWGPPGLEDVIHLVLLSPGQRLAEHLPSFVNVEVTSPQESKDVLIFGDLREERNAEGGCFCHHTTKNANEPTGHMHQALNPQSHGNKG